MALHLSKAAKAVVGGVFLAGSTALGFLPHNDIWFNVITVIVGLAGTYGIYQVPNKKTVAEVETAVKDVVTVIHNHAPLGNTVADVAQAVQDVAADMVTNPVPNQLTPVPNLAAPVSEPSPIPPTAPTTGA